VQHFSIFDYIYVSSSLEDRIIEFADHLHEHFVHPVTMRDGYYVLPKNPGLGADWGFATDENTIELQLADESSSRTA
jgi:hypothetical protein